MTTPAPNPRAVLRAPRFLVPEAPAEAGQQVGHVGPQLEFLRAAYALLVQAGRLLVRSGVLRQYAQVLRRAQLTPAVAQFTEQRRALLRAGAHRGQVAPVAGPGGAGDQYRRHAPAVAGRPELLQYRAESAVPEFHAVEAAPCELQQQTGPRVRRAEGPVQVSAQQ
ncbi:hypothetical protein [Streptomyces sp. Wb2n-11]|uniref:hypothetical protein n=1 Tax=Streptomyces sp. Wb2n-11 TaxID=1030533 RepID=UPI00159EDDD6|nr:hypothetical protein [Streptomyces sp. Wb2n-11]